MSFSLCSAAVQSHPALPQRLDVVEPPGARCLSSLALLSTRTLGSATGLTHPNQPRGSAAADTDLVSTLSSCMGCGQGHHKPCNLVQAQHPQASKCQLISQPACTKSLFVSEGGQCSWGSPGGNQLKVSSACYSCSC